MNTENPQHEDAIDDTEHTSENLSKSQIKRECDALQKLGEELVALKTQELEQMQMPAKLADAVHTARKMHARSGLKRQKQYIGKIMREIDSNTIRRQLHQIRHRHDINNAAFKKTENWRDKLIHGDNTAITDILNAFSELDRQHLNQLVRQAKKEAAEEKPPAAARKLFKYLRGVIDPQA